MKSTSLAELLLRQIMTKAQAEAEVGDLMEVSQTEGVLWFWRAIASTMLYRGWRPMLAFGVAFGVGEFAAAASNRGIFGNAPDMNSVYTSGSLILAPLCIVPVFLLLRYGWRDRHGRLALLFGIAAGASLLCRQNLTLRWTLPAVVVATLVIAFAKTRRARIPLQSLAQLGSGIAISLGGLVLYFSALVSLWVLLSYCLQRPTAFFNVTVLFSEHPVHDGINALVCLLMVRSADRQRRRWTVVQPLES